MYMYIYIYIYIHILDTRTPKPSRPSSQEGVVFKTGQAGHIGGAGPLSLLS